MAEQISSNNKPKRPKDNECCGGGACQPCVWDDYFERLHQWQLEQQIQLQQTSE